ncbi:hypothetical protein D3C76_981330 [compost metagenome]
MRLSRESKRCSAASARPMLMKLPRVSRMLDMARARSSISRIAESGRSLSPKSKCWIRSASCVSASKGAAVRLATSQMTGSSNSRPVRAQTRLRRASWRAGAVSSSVGTSRAR